MKKDRRTLLINSGMELFSRSGFRDVSVDAISRGCGLSVGSFYKHFSSKEEFYDVILGVMTHEGIRKARRVMDSLSSPVNKLRVLYQFIILGVRRYPVLRGVLTGDPRYLYPGIDVAGGAIGSLRSAVEEMIAETIRDGSRRGIFRPGLYENVNGMVLALLELVISTSAHPDIDVLTRDILVLLQRGLRRAIRIPRRDELRDRRILQREESLDPLKWLET